MTASELAAMTAMKDKIAAHAVITAAEMAAMAAKVAALTAELLEQQARHLSIPFASVSMVLLVLLDHTALTILSPSVLMALAAYCNDIPKPGDGYVQIDALEDVDVCLGDWSDNQKGRMTGSSKQRSLSDEAWWLLRHNTLRCHMDCSDDTTRPPFHPVAPPDPRSTNLPSGHIHSLHPLTVSNSNSLGTRSRASDKG